MNIGGGYKPRIAGRPSREVEDVALPDRLAIALDQGGIRYVPVVRQGQPVAFGEVLAQAEIAGGRLALPAPATGTVTLDPGDDQGPSRIRLAVTDRRTAPALGVGRRPERATREEIEATLARAGIWPLVWSSSRQGMPPLDRSETPCRILISGVTMEPFRARGKVILREEWARVTTGIQFLPRLLRDYGSVHLMLTEPSDPLMVRLHEETRGKAWVRLETVPLKYPVEHPEVLCRAMRRSDPKVARGDVLWVLDLQAVAAIGACLVEGMPLHQRLVALGGPGVSNPRHLRVRVGAPLETVLAPAEQAADRRVVRGGLFRGEQVRPEEDSIRYADDGLLVLPRPAGREFLGFARPGFDRVSAMPCFASRLTGAADHHITTSLRGERRPCIACGRCESACPAGIMPQVLHRCLYRQAVEEAEELGLDRCIACGLCSYVCPSKLDLVQEFVAARQRQAEARREAEAAEAARRQQEETRQAEEARKDEWRE